MHKYEGASLASILIAKLRESDNEDHNCTGGMSTAVAISVTGHSNLIVRATTWKAGRLASAGGPHHLNSLLLPVQVAHARQGLTGRRPKDAAPMPVEPPDQCWKPERYPIVDFRSYGRKAVVVEKRKHRVRCGEASEAS